MMQRIIIAGAGGQGIMLLGKIIALCGMKENRFVSWLPSYGAEVRGGSAYCMTTLSDSEIGSPYIEQADILIIMNAPSWRRFSKRIKKGGLAFVNSSLVQPGKKVNFCCISYPYTDLAVKLGNIQTANMIILGTLLAKKKLFSFKTAFKVIEELAPEDKQGLIEINQKALVLGRDLITTESNG